MIYLSQKCRSTGYNSKSCQMSLTSYLTRHPLFFICKSTCHLTHGKKEIITGSFMTVSTLGLDVLIVWAVVI